MTPFVVRHASGDVTALREACVLDYEQLTPFVVRHASGDVTALREACVPDYEQQAQYNQKNSHYKE